MISDGLTALVNSIVVERVLAYAAEGVGIWISTLGLGATLLVASGGCLRRLRSLKLHMAETDATLPLPMFDRRRKRDSRYRLRVTRRNLTREEGRALETLRHAIDYLIEAYELRADGIRPEETRPAEFAAVQLLLQGHAKLLETRPPLPSFAYLFRRRASYLMVQVRH